MESARSGCSTEPSRSNGGGSRIRRTAPSSPARGYRRPGRGCRGRETRAGNGLLSIDGSSTESGGFSAVGRFPGGYRKREGAASEHEILCSRHDRPLDSPPVPRGVPPTSAADGDGSRRRSRRDPPILRMVAASAALVLSDIPWDGPVAPRQRLGIAPEGLCSSTATEEERSFFDMRPRGFFGRDGLVNGEEKRERSRNPSFLEAIERAAAAVKPSCWGSRRWRAVGKPRAAFAVAPARSRDPGGRSSERARTPSGSPRARTIKHERRAILHENAFS